jgi:hypothetical protein
MIIYDKRQHTSTTLKWEVKPGVTFRRIPRPCQLNGGAYRSGGNTVLRLQYAHPLSIIPAGGVFLSAHRLYLQERVVPSLRIPSTTKISEGKASWLPHVGLQGDGDEFALG